MVPLAIGAHFLLTFNQKDSSLHAQRALRNENQSLVVDMARDHLPAPN